MQRPIVDAIAERLIARISAHSAIDTSGIDSRVLAQDYERQYHVRNWDLVERSSVVDEVNRAINVGASLPNDVIMIDAKGIVGKGE